MGELFNRIKWQNKPDYIMKYYCKFLLFFQHNKWFLYTNTVSKENIYTSRCMYCVYPLEQGEGSWRMVCKCMWKNRNGEINVVYIPIEVYTILSEYELYERLDPIGGGGEWLDKYGGVLPFPCI